MRDPTLANMLSRELHDLLYKKTKLASKARAHIENLDVHLGLEGLRAIRYNLFRCDAKKLNEQFDRLTDLPVIKDDALKTLGTLITTWDAELERFYRIDAEYHLGKHQKRQILYKAMPSAMREKIEVEEAAGRLGTYDDFISFILKISTSSIYSKQDKPRPLLAEVTSAPPEPNDDDKKPEQKKEATPPEDDAFTNMVHALWTVFKGNGKGGKGYKGWKGTGKDSAPVHNPSSSNPGSKGGKGDAKGGTQGGKGGLPVGRSGRLVQCWTCGEYGHPQRLCPKNRGNVNEVNDSSSWDLGNVMDKNSYMNNFFHCDLSQLNKHDENGFTYVGLLRRDDEQRQRLACPKGCQHGTNAS